MKNKIRNFTVIAIIVYCVGLIGFLIPMFRTWIVPLTPINIALAFIIALWFDTDIKLNKILLLSGIAATGFFIEYAGVQTGWIFGKYHYGKTLGAGWRNIPFVIGLNWAALVYFSTQFFRIKNAPIWLVSLAQAGIMTLFDYILEPVAVAYDFWTWDSGNIPIRNFIAWFVISTAFTFVWNISVNYRKNEMSRRLLIIQFAFFLILNLALRAQWALL